MRRRAFDPEDGCLNCSAVLEPGECQSPFCDDRCEDEYDRHVIARARRWYLITRLPVRVWHWLWTPIGTPHETA